MKKIVSILLCLCLSFQCLALSVPVSAKNETSSKVTMPNIVQMDTTVDIPSILTVLGQEKPTSKEAYDYVIDLSADTTITQCNIDVSGTYYIYASDASDYAFANIILSEDINAYITIDNITFNSFKATQNSNAEINVVGNVICQYYTSAIGNGNLVITADSTENTFDTCGIFSGNYDKIIDKMGEKAVTGADIDAYDNGNIYIDNVTLNSYGRIGATPIIRYQDYDLNKYEFFSGNRINDIVFNNAKVNVCSFSSSSSVYSGKKLFPSTGIGGFYNNIKILNSELGTLEDAYTFKTQNGEGSIKTYLYDNYIGGLTNDSSKIDIYNSKIHNFNFGLIEDKNILFGARSGSNVLSWDKFNTQQYGSMTSENTVDVRFLNSKFTHSVNSQQGNIGDEWCSNKKINSVSFKNCQGDLRSIVNIENVYIYDNSDLSIGYQFRNPSFDNVNAIYISDSSIYSNLINANKFISSKSKLIFNNMGIIVINNNFKLSEESIINTNEAIIENCNIKAFVNGNAYLFNSTLLNISVDTKISCWGSSTYNMNASSYLLSSDKLNANESSTQDNNDFFATKIISRGAFRQNSISIVDVDNPGQDIPILDRDGYTPSVIFYSSDGSEFKNYTVPKQIVDEYIPASNISINAKIRFDFSDGYFITNDTDNFENTDFYIFNMENNDYFNALLRVFTLDGMKKHFKNAADEFNKDPRAWGFDFSSVEVGMNSIKKLGFTEDSTFYKSAYEFLNTWLSYDHGVTISANDVNVAAKKTMEDVTTDYINRDNKDKQEANADLDYWIKEYLFIADWIVKASEADLDNNTIDTAIGFNKALSLKINTLGDLYTHYGYLPGMIDIINSNSINIGTSDFSDMGFILSQYVDSDGIYHTLFNLNDKNIFNQEQVDILSFRNQTNQEFEYGNLSYFIPKGHSLNTGGISMQNFPHKFSEDDKKAIENMLPNDKIAESYSYRPWPSPVQTLPTIDAVLNTIAPFGYKWQVIMTNLADKKHTITYHTNGLGDIVCEKANGIKTTMNEYSVLQSHGYSVDYTDTGYNNGGGDYTKVSQWTRVHYSLAKAKKQQAYAGYDTNKYYYFVPNDKNTKIIGWKDADGNSFDFTAPVTKNYELTPIIATIATGEVTISVLPEDNSTENFDYSLTQEINWHTLNENEDACTAVVNNSYYNNLAMYNYNDEYQNLVVPAFWDSVTDYNTGAPVAGTAAMKIFEMGDSATGVKNVRFEYGIQMAIVNVDSDSCNIFCPSSMGKIDGIGYLLNECLRTTGSCAKLNIYHCYDNEFKEAVITTCSSDPSTYSKDVITMMFKDHFCDDNGNILPQAEQKATLDRMLADLGLDENDKDNYHFDESDWTVGADGIVTEYTGEGYPMLGLPTTIGGITVKGISPMIAENPTNLENCTLYIPSTVTKLDFGYGYGDASSKISGKDDMTAFSCLKNVRVVVEADNPIYCSYDGSLLNKEQTYVYYIGGTGNCSLPDTITEFSAYSFISDINSYSTGAPASVTCCSTNNVILNQCSITGTHGSYEYKYVFACVYFKTYWVGLNETKITLIKDSPLHKALCNEFQQYITESADDSLTISDYEQDYLTFFASTDVETRQISMLNPYRAEYSNLDDYIYTFKMINLPERYKTPQNVTFSPIDKLKDYQIRLELKKGAVNISSVNENTNEAISGTYEVYNADTNALYTTISSGDVAAIIEYIPYGSYYAKQISVEAGYELNSDKQVFSITEDGQNINISFKNKVSVMYSVRIPKTISIDGKTGNCNYSVSVKGSISSESQIIVSPKVSYFNLNPITNLIVRKKSVKADINQNKSIWLSTDLSSDWSTTDGIISAPDISAGKWNGTIVFTIQIK